MIIRKLFKFTNKHIVRNCSSNRCKYSIHGHTYQVEIFLEGNKLDNGSMILDFGILKGPVKNIFKAFENSYSYWSKESCEFQSYIIENNRKILELPFSPSAECYSIFFFYLIDRILSNTKFSNGEGKISLKSVRVHETETGYAECFKKDLKKFKKKMNLNHAKYIDKYDKELQNFFNDLVSGSKIKFVNNKVEQQI